MKVQYWRDVYLITSITIFHSWPGQEILAYTNLLRHFKILAKLEVFLKLRSRSVLLTFAPYRGNNCSTFLCTVVITHSEKI